MINYDIKNKFLSQEEYNQYAKHIILDQVGIHGQSRLKAAKVLLVGAGGLGCPCITYLATSGIGCIGIIDNDIISISNLQRQILYYKSDINKLKTEIAEQKIYQINPKCLVQVYSYQINKNNAFNIIKNYDIIIDTSDNFSTRYIIDEICYKLHKIHVYGAIQNFEGQISVFNYMGGPKYSDLYPKHLKLEDKACSNLGVLGVLPGIIGILQATETIKIIIGLSEILSGYMILYNAHDMSFKKIKILAEKKYTYKEKNNTYKKKQYISSKELLSKNPNHIILLDVRQKVEFKEQKIQNAINIPLREMMYKYNIDLLNKTYKNKQIIIYCSYNSRAILASQILSSYNINHFILNNGLKEWLIYATKQRQ